jgi:RNA polymerase sporulation-specific sigma factor
MKENEKAKDTAALIRRVRENDQAAFTELLDAYKPLLHAEVARHTAELATQDVEDLRQVALLALYRATLSFNLEQSEVEFGLYAKICIANALASQLRAIHRRKLEIVGAELPEGDGGEGDPARRLMEREAVEALLARIQGLLSPYENRVWSLFVAGFSVRDIARAVGKEPHSVENAVYRIRKKLRLALGDRG